MTLKDSLLPTAAEHVNRARSDLAMGLPCILSDGADRAVLVPLETVSALRFDALQDRLGMPEFVISATRAQAVMTAAAAANLGQGPVRILPPQGATLDWFGRLADPAMDRDASALGPLHVLRDGGAAIPDAGLRLVKSAQLIPAFFLFPMRSPGAVDDLSITALRAEDARATLDAAPVLTPVAAAGLPLEAHDVSRLHVFRDPDGAREHYAIEIGTLRRDMPVLTRVHSACFTGDVLGSLKCDCGPQLRTALARMGEEGAGMLLYLNQEGRGIGLANKMRVYDLQSQGFDTVEANHRLGYEDDERDFPRRRSAPAPARDRAGASVDEQSRQTRDLVGPGHGCRRTAAASGRAHPPERALSVGQSAEIRAPSVTGLAQALWITAAGTAELRATGIGDGEIEIRTLYSGISRGTERLVLAGEVPASEYDTMRAPFQEGAFSFPREIRLFPPWARCRRAIWRAEPSLRSFRIRRCSPCRRARPLCCLMMCRPSGPFWPPIWRPR